MEYVSVVEPSTLATLYEEEEQQSGNQGGSSSSGKVATFHDSKSEMSPNIKFYGI